MRGIPDSLSIFLGGWFNSNGTIPDLVDIGLRGWFESDIAKEDYREYSAMPNDYFQEEDSAYDRESDLFNLLYTEAINMNGVPMIYYVNTFKTSYDKIFGEDNTRSVLRNFNIKAYFSLPNEDEMWSRFNIEGIDNFHIEITMRHFETASQYNPQGTAIIYPSYTPKEGDFLKAKYNEYFYEIVTVKKQVAQFLKRQHVWDLIVRPMRDEKLSVSATIPSDDYVRAINDIEDIFNVSAAVENEMPDKLYDSAGESSVDPLFGSW